MIVDTLNPDGYDVVIIGSGPAGIPAALRLAERSAARILIVESGTLESNDQIQKLSEVTGDCDLGALHFAFHAHRRLGGTSLYWGGWIAALEKRAFDMDEWPISYDEIDYYYPEAAEILEVSHDAYLYKEAEIQGSPGIVYKPFYRADPVRFQTKYEDVLAAHPTVDLVLQRTCLRLESEGDVIVQAILADSLAPEAETIAVKAKHFILACGGIGNPRVLQHSNLAPNSPVGRYLMEHPHLHGVSRIFLDEDKFLSYVPESWATHALQLSSARCIEEDLLSFSLSFDLDQTEEKPLLGRKEGVIVADVTIRAEMVPQFENRFSLGEEVDYLGQRKGHVDFRFNYEDLGRKTWQVFADELLRSGLGRPAGLPPEFQIGGGGHYIGTTRMGTSEFESVVDRDCKVHSTSNLFIAGSSVFPAGGVANPTYSIVALSLRLADHVAAQLEEV